MLTARKPKIAHISYSITLGPIFRFCLFRSDERKLMLTHPKHLSNLLSYFSEYFLWIPLLSRFHFRTLISWISDCSLLFGFLGPRSPTGCSKCTNGQSTAIFRFSFKFTENFLSKLAFWPIHPYMSKPSCLKFTYYRRGPGEVGPKIFIKVLFILTY